VLNIIEPVFKYNGGRCMNFTRITIHHSQMNGMHCIRGLRIPVATIVAMVAEGMNDAEILAAYPDLEKDDITESLQYVAEKLHKRELPVLTANDVLS
jgi:uncharacterized protein (DUF433 family)